MSTSRVLLLGFAGLVVVFGLIQLVPYGRDHTNPPVIQEPNWANAQTRELAVRACYNCHSNEVTWPWYSNIAPVSWLVQHDVQEGRATLNFSEWGVRGRGVAEAAEVVAEGEMPPRYYTLVRPGARLSATEKQTLVQGLAALSGSGQVGEEDERGEEND
jgi:hypothetical protein